MQTADPRTIRSELERNVTQRVLKFLNTLDIQKIMFAILPLNRTLTRTHQSQHLRARQTKTVRGFIAKFHHQPIRTGAGTRPLYRTLPNLRNDARNTPCCIEPAIPLNHLNMLLQSDQVRSVKAKYRFSTG